MTKINRKYKVPSALNNINDNVSDRSFNKSERAKKHNLGNITSKSSRKNYQGFYKSNIPKVKNDSGAKHNLSMGYHRSNKDVRYFDRKSSPLHKFTPKHDPRVNLGESEFGFDDKSQRYTYDKTNPSKQWVKEKSHEDYTPYGGKSPR